MVPTFVARWSHFTTTLENSEKWLKQRPLALKRENYLKCVDVYLLPNGNDRLCKLLRQWPIMIQAVIENRLLSQLSRKCVEHINHDVIKNSTLDWTRVEF